MEEAVARYCAIAGAQQCFENFALAGRERYLVSVDCAFARGDIEGDSAAFQNIGCDRHRSPSHQRTHPSDQHDRREWLTHVVVGAEFKAV